MFKVTPNPPETDAIPESDPTSPYSTLDPTKLNDAAERALDHYLKPQAPPQRTPSSMFVVAPHIDTESLLAHACESMASASIMLSDFAGLLETPYRNTLLGIQQVVMLGELAVNRALDKNEIRITEDSGAFRVFYVVNRPEAIYVLHAMHKTARKTETRDIELARARYQEIG